MKPSPLFLKDSPDEGVTPTGSGHSAEPEPISVVSAVTASVPNAECIGCGLPLTIPADILETEPEGFHCAGCYFVGAPR